MAQTCWENVLVEWVNCLNLCKAIDSLEELREGAFYRSLLKIVKSPGTEGSTANFIFNLLKRQYPNFVFDSDDATTSWTNFSHTDLISITSLLLHHTCITDRQEAITLPLCSKLPQLTQLNIKLFLENVDFDVTKEKLVEVIEQCSRIEQLSPTDPSFHSVYEASSLLSCDSPLQDLFNGTPKGKKFGLIQKEREIKQLKRDLELERYEKADLQEELKMQQEKNDDLKNALSAKNKENKRLKGEILALQNKTPPHFNHGDSLQMQRRLKAEIEHLEGYVNRLEKEQCDLEEELKTKSDLVKKLEKEYQTWQGKAILLETTNETLNEKLEQQHIELNNLQQNCKELAAMLDEFKQTKSPDTSVNWVSNIYRRSLGSTDTNEDLAQTVVDVQLKELQKENNDLRNSLKEYVDKTEQLNLELNEITVKYENSEKELFELQEINAELCKNLLTCQESLKTCEKKLENSCKVGEKIRNENVVLQESIVKLEKEQNDNKNIIEHLQNELTSSKTDCGTLEANLREKENNLQQLKQEKDSLSDELSETKSKLKETFIELESIEEQHKKLDMLMEKYYKSLELILFGKTDLDVSYEDKEQLLRVLLENIENQVKTKAEEHEILNEKIVNLQQKIENQNEKEQDILLEKHQVEENLKTCEEDLKTSKKQLENACEVNNQVRNENLTLQENIAQSKKEQALLSKNLEDCKNLIEHLQNELTNSKTDCETLKAKLREKESNLQQLKQEKDSVFDELSEIKDRLKETSLELDSAVKQHKKLDMLMEKYYNSLELILFGKTDLDVSYEDKEQLFVVLLENIENQVKTKAEEHEILNEKIVNLQQQIEELNEKERNILLEKHQVEEKLKTYEEDLKTTKKQLENACEINNQVRNENVSLQKNIIKLEKEQVLLSDNLEDCKNLIQHLQNELTNSKIDCETLEVNLREKESNLQQLKQEKDSLSDELSETKSKLKETSVELESIVEQHKKLDMLMENYYKSLELILFGKTDVDVSYEDKEQLFRVLLENIENQIKTKAEEHEILNEKIVSLQQQIEELNEKEQDILMERREIEDKLVISQAANKELQVLNNAYCVKTKELEMNILELKECVEKLNELITEKCNTITHLQTQNNNLIVEFSQVNEKITKLKSKYNEMLTTSEKLQNVIQEKQLQIDDVSAKLNETLKDVDYHKNEIEKLQTEKVGYVEKIETLTNEKTDLLKKCEIFENKISNLEQLLSELHTVEKQLTQTIAEKETEIDRLKTTTENNEKQSKETLNETIRQYTFEIESLKATISELNAIISDFNCKEIDYLKEIEQLKHDLSNINDKYTESLQAQQEIKSESEVQIANLTENLHDLVAKYNECETKYEKSNVELQNANKLFEALKSEKNELVEQVKKQCLKLIEFTNSLNDLIEVNCDEDKVDVNLDVDTENFCIVVEKMKEKITQFLHQVSTLLKKLKAENDDTKTVCLTMQTNLNDLHNQNKQILFKHQGEIADLMRKIEKLTATSNESENKYTTCCFELKIANELIDSLKSENCELEKHLKNHCNDLIEFAKSFKDTNLDLNLDFDCENVCFVMDNIMEKIRTIPNQISDLLGTLKTENDDSKKICMSMQASLNDLYAQIQKTEDDYRTLLSEKEFEIKNYEIMIDNCEQQIRDVTNRQKQLECDIEKWKKQCGEYEVVVADYENKIISMKDVQEFVEVEKETLQRECNGLKDELNSCKENEKQHEEIVRQLNLKIDSLEDKMREASEIQQQLQEEQINLELAWKKEKQILLDDAKKIKTEKQALEETLKTATTNNETIKDLVREYKEILTEKTETINKLEVDLKNNQEECRKLKNEKQQLQDNFEKIKNKLELVEKEKEDLSMQQTKLLQEAEEKRLNTLKEEEEAKNCLSQKIASLLNAKSELSNKLENEKQLKVALEVKISTLEMKKCQLEDLFVLVVKNLQKLESGLSEKPFEDLNENELPEMLTAIVEKVLERHNFLQNNNWELERNLSENKEMINDLQLKFDLLQAKHEHNEETEQQEKKVAELEGVVNKFQNNFALLCNQLKVYQEKLEKVFSELFATERLLDTTKAALNQLPVINETNHRLLHERKEGLEIIVEDVNKQARKFSRKFGGVVCKLLHVFENAISNNFNGDLKYDLSESLNIDDEFEFLQDLKSRTEDALQQINILNKDIDHKLATKPTGILKENTNPLPTKPIEDDLKRKNTLLKQRVTLAENAKSNLERKIKQLREENKKLMESVSLGCVSKLEHERILNSNTTKYQNLLQQYEELASRCADVSQMKGGENETQYKQLHMDYCNLMDEKLRLERQHEATMKTLEDYAAQVAELGLIKEAYDKLVEENNQLMTECDTLNYKRTRDREEFGRALQEAKKEGENKESKRIREIRSEYEAKLEKMKEKMIKLYRDEVDKEMQKLSSEKSENVYLMRNIEQLRGHLQEANLKMHQLELERDRAIDRMKHLQKQLSRQENELFNSRESLRSIVSREGSVISGTLPRGERPNNNNNACRSSVVSKISSNSVAPLNTFDSVGGRSEVDFDEGCRMGRTTSVSSLPADIGHNLKMEDEDDDFNNKYLSDLKEGRCVLPAEKKTNPADRLSELAWRNSLCPPHLKSSYPAELQFVSPRCFKEDDIKAGNIDLDDSMSTKLLPSEKPRNKKDIGTTSYKKPGPPTPSKNGGRLSLQGSECKDPSQEQQPNSEVKTPKRMTPGRLKSLFMGRNLNTKDNSEVLSSSSSSALNSTSLATAIFTEPDNNTTSKTTQ